MKSLNFAKDFMEGCPRHESDCEAPILDRMETCYCASLCSLEGLTHLNCFSGKLRTKRISQNFHSAYEDQNECSKKYITHKCRKNKMYFYKLLSLAFFILQKHVALPMTMIIYRCTLFLVIYKFDKTKLLT